MASTQLLTNRKGLLIGKMVTETSGVQTLFGKNGTALGKYDPRTGTTTDHRGRVVGKGNLLASLLPPST